jgi:hypothetical protein
MVLTVKVTVARPLESVELEVGEKDPPVPVLVQVTTLPEAATLLLLASTS